MLSRSLGEKAAPLIPSRAQITAVSAPSFYSRPSTISSHSQPIVCNPTSSAALVGALPRKTDRIDKEAIFVAMLAKAVDQQLLIPDLGVNKEIAEIVRAKPRKGDEVLKALLPVVNGFSKHRAWLALCLLDMLAERGGRTFRMILGRREWMNKLVGRFPLRPPRRPDEIQEFIIYLLAKWKACFYEHGKHGHADFEGIGAMCALMESKGTRLDSN